MPATRRRSNGGAKLDPYILNFAAELRSKPGTKLLFRTCPVRNTASATARNIRIGKYKAFPVGEYDAVLGGRGEREVWVVYTGPRGGSEG